MRRARPPPLECEDMYPISPCRARARRHVAVERSARCLDPPVCTSRSASSSGSSCPCPFSRRRPPPQSPRQSLRNGRADQSAREQRQCAGRGEGIRVHATRAQHVLGGVCMCVGIACAATPGTADAHAGRMDSCTLRARRRCRTRAHACPPHATPGARVLAPAVGRAACGRT